MVLLNLNSRNAREASLYSRKFSKPHDFEINFNVPLEFSPDSQIALIGCNLWYSWHNISEIYNTNKLKYFNQNKSETIVFPEGNYDFDDIQDYINDYFKTDDPPIQIRANTVTLRTKIFLNSGYKLDLTEKGSGELYNIFGFEPQIIDNSQESKRKSDITRGVDRILIHCSIVGGSYENSFESDVIYSFVPNDSPGSILNIQPFHPIYLPLKEEIVRKIRMRLTDQDDRPIDLNEQNVDYLLEIKDKY